MITELPADRIDELRALRDELRVHHERTLAEPPGYRTRDGGEAWREWRAATVARVAGGDGALLVHGPHDGGPWDGFALVGLTPALRRPILEPTGPAGELLVLVVGDAARGGGIGAALHDAAAAWLRARGVVAMAIAVRGDNAGALRFYAARGAVPTIVTMLQDLTAG